MNLAEVTWEKFITTKTGYVSIQSKFEDLCRQLFKNELLKNNKIVRFVHSNPNNPGLESDPIYDEACDRWIGYQVKFFENNVNYADILDSANKTIEYYGDQVDYVYLYCNKPISVTAQNYIKTKEILASKNIEIVLVTDKEILDQVRKYQYLANLYFSSQAITHEWLVEHAQQVIDTLGERYNANFNIDTNSSHQLSLFIHDDRALKYLNGKKQRLLEKINRLNNRFQDYDAYLEKIQNIVEGIPNVTKDNIIDSFEWESYVENAVQTELNILLSEQKLLKTSLDKLEASITQEKNHIQNNRNESNKTYDIKRKINIIETLIKLPNLVCVEESERALLTKNILIIQGPVGLGKTQLLSNAAVTLLNDNRDALLLNAGIYYTDEPIQEQIMNNCFLEYQFEDLIDMLEAMGERQGTVIPILIDAINETSNKDLWKNGLISIIRKVESLAYVKIVFSYRTEYEKLLLNEVVQNRLQNGDFCNIYHFGFVDNSIEAARKFFDYYNIPFTPFEYFSYEMTSPLFLTLYCRTYEGDEVSLPTLCKRLLEHANKNIHQSMKNALKQSGYSGIENLLTPFIDELAEFYLENGKRFITKRELLHFRYWNEAKIACAPFISQLKNEKILYELPYSEEHFFFAYDYMNDYFCAKAVIDKEQTKDEIKAYIVEKVLKIQDGKINSFGNNEIFVNVCMLYAEKFGEECIEVIDVLDDKYNEKEELFASFVNSFQWRKRETISTQEFVRLINKYHAYPEDIWTMLISNSMKVNHPLNADFLHNLLSKYQLSKRDLLWTTYINTIFSDDSNRITQLVKSYNQGKYLDIKNEKQVKLLLTLFSWLLTSSDRTLRDFTSKAMVEILKKDFELNEWLLIKFEGVNDPYVIQRLYGVVFGACCKRTDLQRDSYQSLAEYVYNTIFDQEKVYPDILLRDYARLIIERFLWEFKDYDGIINREKIKPPYTSDEIPTVHEEYEKKEYHKGLYDIQHSMKFANMGWYGDFGRYVFQSALCDFEVDLKQVYNYAMSFIINELGYSEDLSEIDRTAGSYNRYTAIKIERIGKKYQWIAMYNILARISDNCKMRNYEGKDMTYKGAWDPYVRDFDPTLNKNFMTCPVAPYFQEFSEYIANAQDENKTTVLTTPNDEKEWLATKGYFLENAKNNIIFTDKRGVKWVSLTKFCHTGHSNMKKTRLYVWNWIHAFFVTEKQEKELKNTFDKGIELLSDGFTGFNESYTIFNYEYPWATSCEQLKEYAWRDISIKTGVKKKVTEKRPKLKFVFWDDDVSDDNEGKLGDIVDDHLDYEIVTYEKDVKKDIGKILCATTDLVWEEEFDATKEETITRRVPCAEMMEVLNLRQKLYDGFYFDDNNQLVAFDTLLNDQKMGLVIRKDSLDSFLKKAKMKLVWVLQGAKEIHNKEFFIEKNSDWAGLFIYDNGMIQGDIRKEKGRV